LEKLGKDQLQFLDIEEMNKDMIEIEIQSRQSSNSDVKKQKIKENITMIDFSLIILLKLTFYACLILLYLICFDNVNVFHLI